MTRNADESRDATPFLLHEITRRQAAARAANALVVLPVGATEQHGPHLPLGTDYLIVEHITREAAREARQWVDVLVAPTLHVGSSHHHLPFGGTISLATERYYGALCDMVESLVESGFRRIFILNGHGGNHEIIQLVARDLALKHPVNLGAASYWDLAREVVAEREPDLHGRFPGHAGVFETSLIMALRPDLVDEPRPHRTEEELARTIIPTDQFRAERHGFWLSIDGYTDSPDLASAELGRRLLGGIVPAVAGALVHFAHLPLVGGETED
ncbi:MAG: creatininase family protein [Chloroflexi bacterium]|nr:creatininase family protein [Chloroflexota bacterium]